MEFDSNQLQDAVPLNEQPEEPKTMPKPINERHGFDKWGSLLVLSLALAIIVIDTTILNVAFSTILKDLHTTIESMQWVITAYALMLAAFTITGGRLGDIFGRKKMFVTGAIIFAIGSLISSLSHNVTTLILGEAIIEGIGAALMLPATSSLLVTNYEGKDRAIAFGVWGGIAGASAALGPLLGGYLTTNYSWRWGFRVNIVVVLLLLAGSYLIHETVQAVKKTTLDIGGVILSASGLFSIVFGIIKASDFGWIDSKQPFHLFGHVINLGQFSPTPIFIILGIIIMTGFYFWELRVTRTGGVPLINMDVFKNKTFVAGISTLGLMTLGMTGIFFTLPVFLQSVRGFSALHTGVALLPMPLMLLVGSPFAVYLSHKFQPKYLIATGILISSLAALWLRSVINVNLEIPQLIAPLGLYGFGLGLGLSQINNITLSAVPNSEAGEASGISNTMRQLGSTLGSAIIGAVLISVLTLNLHTGIQSSTVIPDQARNGIDKAAAAQVNAIEFGSSVSLGPNASQSVKSEIVKIANQATTTATKTTLLYTAGFAFLAFLGSFTLPRRKFLIGQEHLAEADEKVNTTTTMPSNIVKQSGRMSIDEALAATTRPEIIPTEIIQEQELPVVASTAAPRIVPVPAPSPAVVRETVVRTLHPVQPVIVTEENRKYGPAIAAGIFALLIAAAAGLFGGYEWGVKNEQTKIASNSNAQPGALYTILNQPVLDDSQTQPLSSADSSDKQHSQVLGSSITAPAERDSVPAPTPVQKPVAVAAQSAFKTYNYAGASLLITVPTSWTISQADNDGTILKIYDATQAFRGQIFIQAGVNETLNQKQTELEANPQVTSLSTTTFHGIPAFSYFQNGISGRNIILEYKGSLYTFSQGAEQEAGGYSLRFY